MSLIRGRRYNRVKHQGKRTDLTLGQNDTKLPTAELLAKEHGVSPAAVHAKYFSMQFGVSRHNTKADA